MNKYTCSSKLSEEINLPFNKNGLCFEDDAIVFTARTVTCHFDDRAKLWKQLLMLITELYICDKLKTHSASLTQRKPM